MVDEAEDSRHQLFTGDVRLSVGNHCGQTHKVDVQVRPRLRYNPYLHLNTACRQCTFINVMGRNVYDYVYKWCHQVSIGVSICLPVRAVMSPDERCVINIAIMIAIYRRVVLFQGFKAAYITPRLKKPDLDPADVKSFRPISNLTVLSKLMERLVARQLLDHVSVHKLLCRTSSPLIGPNTQQRRRSSKS